MAEYTAVEEQTVQSGYNVLFTDTPIGGTKCIQHRSGSGLVTLRGITSQCNARFMINYGANIAIPTGGSVNAISLGIAINGEPVQSSIATVTPAAVGEYFNVSKSEYVQVPAGCCVTISLENTSTESVLVENANMIVTRVS